MRSRVHFSIGCLVVCALHAQAQRPGESDSLVTDLSKLLEMEVSSVSRYSERTTEAPASTSIVTAQQIADFGYRSLADILQSVRGFYLSNDRNYSYLGVRGFSRPTDYNNRILLLLNGHVMNDNVYNSAMIGTEFGLPVDMIERVEIVRGPNSTLYGPGAVFAVINIITKMGKDVDCLKLAAEAGSGAHLGADLLYGTSSFAGNDLLIAGQWADTKGADLYYPEFDAPSTDNGTARRLDWDRSWGIMTRFTSADVSMQLSATHRAKGLPTAPYGTTFNDPGAQTIDELATLGISYTVLQGTTTRLSLRGYADYYNYKGVYPYSDAVQHDGSKGLWGGMKAELQWDTDPSNRLTIGLEPTWNARSDYRLWYETSTVVSLNDPYRFISAFLQDHYQMANNLSAVAGVRYDQHSEVGTLWSPRAGLVYNPGTNNALKLLYGIASRMPTVYELRYEEPGLQKVAQNLKPERVRTAEFVWEQPVIGGVSAAISLYHSWMDNLIDQQTDPVDSLSQFQNTGSAQAAGLDAGITLQSRAGMSGFANYTFQDAWDVRTHAALTNSPAHVIVAGVTMPLFSPLKLSAQWRFESSRVTVYGTRTGSFNVVDMTLAALSVSHKFDVTLMLRNLFDTHYAYPGGFEHLQPTIPQDGRTLLFRAGIHL